MILASIVHLFYYTIPMKKVLFTLPLLAFILSWCGTNDSPTHADNLEKPSIEKSDTEVDILPVEMRIIEVQASRFKYEPNEIRVKKWEEVVLKIIDVDTDHGAMFGDMNVVYNEDETITLDTSTVWSYDFRCATFCGWWHMDMKWTVIVE